MKKKGAEILVASLLEEGVEVIFGFPGGAVLPIYDVLFENMLKHILVRHEQGAVHAADGYSRASGKPGICLVTSGPGATNTVTGIATAYMDSIPLIVFTGQVPSPLIGNDAFQEADIVGITRPCTKHSFLVKEVNKLALTIKEAFYIARTGRPGPVLIDLPKDVLNAEAIYQYPQRINLPGYNPTREAHGGQIKKVASALLNTRKPLIYAGGGIILSEAAEELREFAHLLSLPVTTTLMGLGSFPGDDPLFLGMCGMHGTYAANMAITESDLLLGIGVRFDDRVTGRIDHFAPEAEVVHIDVDPGSIGKNVRVNIPIVGDAKNALKKLLFFLKQENKFLNKDFTPWAKKLKVWKEEHPLSYKQEEEIIKPQYVIEEIFNLTRGEAIIATEVGQNQMWAAQFYKFLKPRSLLTSGGLGTMGYGFPAAIGAQAAFPDRVVFDIAGDGSFQMNSQELATAVQYNLPVKIAILNNRFLGMVRQWQELFFERRYSSSGLESGPDFVKLAEAYGAAGLRAEKPAEVKKVLQEALKISKPVVMDFRVAPEENVYPMVPAGAAINEMILV